MTCENLYSTDAAAAFEQYKKKNLDALNRYANMPAVPHDLMSVLRDIKTLSKYKRDLEVVQPGRYTCNIVDSVTQKYKSLISESEHKKEEIRKRYEDMKNSRKAEHAKREHEARQHNESLDGEMRRLHNELCKYSAPMREIFERYSVTPLDTAITESTTEKDFIEMLQCSIALCQKYVKRDHDVLQRAIDYLQDDDFSVPYIVAIAAVALVVLYAALPFLSIVFFTKLFLSMHNFVNDMDGLRLAAALMSEIDYARFIPEESYIHVEELSMDDIETGEKEALANVADYSMEYLQEEGAAQKTAQEIENMHKEFLSEFDAKRRKLLQDVTVRLGELEAKKTELLSNMALFPDNQNISSVMRHTYVLQRLEGAVDVTTDVGICNLTFDVSDRVSAIYTMKLYLMNALLSVKPGNLRVEILDSASQCKDFTEFFHKDVDFVKPCTDEFQSRIKKYKELVQDNIKSFHGKTIDEVNADLEKDDRICKPYDLFIVLDKIDAKKDTSTTDTFESFLEYSASMGVYVWLLDRAPKAYTKFVQVPVKNGDTVPIQYSFSMGSTMMDKFAATYQSEKKKIAVLPYFDTYFNKACPPDKIWSYNTIKGIEVNFGYADGDPSRPETILFGDNNVHAILVGGTGSGKSATINQMISTLISKYPPSELIINFIDLKNSEAAKFAYKAAVNEKDKTIPDVITKDMLEHSRIPHMNILSGTSDGAYSLSIIESLLEEMTRRQKLCSKYGTVKIEDLRKKYPEIVVPRILTIIDEFQQMFNAEVMPRRTIDKITGLLEKYVKLARAFGGHLLFASQSMTGTLSADVLANFRLRCALSCDANVSNAVLGNNASSLLPPKGYIYTNDTGGSKKEANRLWRIPFLDTDPLLQHIESLNAKLDVCGEKTRNAILYDEARLYNFHDLDEVYETYPELLEDSNVFVLGAYTSYTESKIPYTIQLKNDASENIIIAAFDKVDILNLTSTILENLRLKKVRTIINVQDKETMLALEPERYVEDELLSVASPDTTTSEMIDAVEDIIAGRMNSGDTVFSPVYVCLVMWDRDASLESYKIEERFFEMLKLGPVYNVHFILACGQKGSISKRILKACLHSISGKSLEADDIYYLGDICTTKFPSRDMIDTQGNFAIHKIGDSTVKFKIYQRDYKNTDSSRVVTIK